jgi:hypothetical protein
MQYVIGTSHDSEDNTFREGPRFYGFFSFKEGAYHVGEKLTQDGGPEAGRMFDVHEVIHPGPSSLAEWLMKVREEIERQFTAFYDVNDDKFYDNPVVAFRDEDEPANAAYKGAKIAMQLLEVQ